MPDGTLSENIAPVSQHEKAAHSNIGQVHHSSLLMFRMK